ncbi:MAG: hypothetical protein IJU87_03715 [Lachnospiraceae bacterium]|nr:hypothetical protein [Lachnospiraceae bacterium]
MRKKLLTKQNILLQKRDLSASSSLRVLKGSLTIETALVLPLFIFAVLSLIMIGEAVRFSGNMSAALLENGRKLSTYAYAVNKAGMDGSLPGGKAVSLTVGRGMVVNDLKKENPGKLPVESDLGGLSFIHSSVLGADQMIDLNAVWRMKVFFPLPGVKGFRVIDRARIRAFTGYDNTRREDRSGEEDEEMVFITEKGTVYHRDRNCSHLNLNIRHTTKASVGKERNNAGGKYYPCEYCGGGSGENLYITDDGDRYHTKISCPGLKRTVKTVPISETGGRPPCADCGGG